MKEAVNKGLIKIPANLNRVNLPARPDPAGITELADYADLYYSACEAYEKALADGQIDIKDVVLLGNVTINLIKAIEGTSGALHEAANLSPGEIEKLTERSGSFSLEDNAEKYRQALRFILTAVKTGSLLFGGTGKAERHD